MASLAKRSAALRQLTWPNSSCQDWQCLVLSNQHPFWSSPGLSPWRDSFYHLYLSTSISDSYRGFHYLYGFSDDAQARIWLPLAKIPVRHPSSPPLSLLSTWCLKCERFYLENRVKLESDIGSLSRIKSEAKSLLCVVHHYFSVFFLFFPSNLSQY